MDTLQISLFENGLNQVLKSNECERTNFRNNVHCVKILEDLQSLRKNEVLCDIRNEADDGKIVFAHKNILMASSPYFCAMFSNFYESNKDLVNIRFNSFTTIGRLYLYWRNYSHKRKCTGFVTSWKPFTVRFCKSCMYCVFAKTTECIELSWYQSIC